MAGGVSWQFPMQRGSARNLPREACALLTSFPPREIQKAVRPPSENVQEERLAETSASLLGKGGQVGERGEAGYPCPPSLLS